MKRRLTTALALLLIAMPLVAETQQAGKVWRIGYLAGSPRVPQIDALVQGLRDLGYVDEGQNLVLEMIDSTVGEFQTKYPNSRPTWFGSIHI